MIKKLKRDFEYAFSKKTDEEKKYIMSKSVQRQVKRYIENKINAEIKSLKTCCNPEVAYTYKDEHGKEVSVKSRFARPSKVEIDEEGWFIRPPKVYRNRVNRVRYVMIDGELR